MLEPSEQRPFTTGSLAAERSVAPQTAPTINPTTVSNLCQRPYQRPYQRLKTRQSSPLTLPYLLLPAIDFLREADAPLTSYRQAAIILPSFDPPCRPFPTRSGWQIHRTRWKRGLPHVFNALKSEKTIPKGPPSALLIAVQLAFVHSGGEAASRAEKGRR